MYNNLNDLYLFATVVKSGGFTNAAQVLGISKSKISRRISALEEALGHALMHRTPRAFALTEMGRVLYAQSENLLSFTADVTSKIQSVDASHKGLVKIGVPSLFGLEMFPHVCQRFYEKFPEIKLVVRVSNDLDNIISEGYDLVIRGGKVAVNDTSTIVCKKLGGANWTFFASPTVLKTYGAPRDVDDIKKYSYLGYSPVSKMTEDLVLYHEGGSSVSLTIEPKIVSNSMEFLKRLAIDDFGICCLPYYSCHHEIQIGLLVPILQGWAITTGDLYAMYPSKKNISTTTRAFLDFLETDIKENSIISANH